MTQKKRQLSHFLNFYVFLTVELPRQIQERTGYDLRNAHDFAILQMAALLYRWQHPDAADPDVPDAFSKDPAESP